MRAFNISETKFAEVPKDDTVRTPVEQRIEYQVQLNDKLRTLREGHAEIRALRARIDSLNEQISDQVETIKLSLETDFDIVSRRE